MKIIEEIHDSPDLMKAVDRSDHLTKKGFAALLAFIGKGARDPGGVISNEADFIFIDGGDVSFDVSGADFRHPHCAIDKEHRP